MSTASRWIAARSPQTTSYGDPEFVKRGYYVDVRFTCQQCGETQIWTAQQQKWWYETAKGGIWTTARLCRPCRQRERARRVEARRVHMEGLARKRAERESTQLPRTARRP